MRNAKRSVECGRVCKFQIIKKPVASILAPSNGVGTQTHGTSDVAARGNQTTSKDMPTATVPASFSYWLKKLPSVDTRAERNVVRLPSDPSQRERTIDVVPTNIYGLVKTKEANPTRPTFEVK